LCIGSQGEAPLETRLVHGPELGNTIHIVDKRQRSEPTPAPRPGSVRRRRRAWTSSPSTKPVE
jgi:hypothetical protein